MAQSYVDIAILTIERTGQPSTKLRDVTSISLTTTEEARVVFTMQASRLGRGYADGAVNVSGEIETAMPKGGLEVDWYALMRDKEVFLLQMEKGHGGERYHLVDVRVDECQEGEDAEGNARLRIRFKALDYRRDQSNPVVL